MPQIKTAAVLVIAIILQLYRARNSVAVDTVPLDHEPLADDEPEPVGAAS